MVSIPLPPKPLLSPKMFHQTSSQSLGKLNCVLRLVLTDHRRKGPGPTQSIYSSGLTKASRSEKQRRVATMSNTPMAGPGRYAFARDGILMEEARYWARRSGSAMQNGTGETGAFSFAYVR
jgi:hypothetical protein